MQLLGIDYGRKKIGLAIATSKLAEPYSVVRFKSEKDAVGKIAEILKAEGIEKIVLGISEGKMAEETKEFGEKLKGALGMEIVYFDETLTTQSAQTLSREAGIGRKKRRKLEDAYSAALILQNYIENLTR